MYGSKFMILAGVSAFAMLLPMAKADEWNQRTNVTFSGPVEIPGKVLPAGTYEFKLMNSQADRNIVQVFSKNQRHLYGTFLTVPDYHLKPKGKTVITFEERTAGSPEAVKAWFYPGDNYGHEFVYPKAKALQLAKANNTPVASMPDEMAANTTKPAATMKEPSVTAMKQTPLKAQKPNQEEVDVIEVFPAPPPSENHQQNSDQQGSSTMASSASTPPAHANMPRTASPVPLVGLMGLLFLGTAGYLRFALKQER